MLLACMLGGLAGCSRFKFHKESHETVYVWTRKMYLRDRVAAVSNHVGEVTNGQPLEVLEHGRRFLRVKTATGEMGWIPERAVIDKATYDGFSQLAGQHKNDPVVANGTLRDEVYLHVNPGRETDRFYLLPENEKVVMLVRASVAKAAAGTPAPKPVVPQTGANPGAATQPEAPVLEDWWLIRDGEDRTGWVLANRVDVSVPDEIAQYAEGQRMVGAYVIAKVRDDESSVPDHMVPEYVTALSPPKAGLPYDFDQIRVFTWSLKRHRYETAFRIRPIQGYLPVAVTSEPAPGGTEPVFSFQISTSPDISINPETGIARPVAPRTLRFALRDTSVRRVGPDVAPIPVIRSAEDKAKAAQKKAARKK